MFHACFLFLFFCVCVCVCFLFFCFLFGLVWFCVVRLCLLCFVFGKVLTLKYEGFSGLWQEKADRWSVSLEHLAFCTGGSCVNACLFSLEMTYSKSAEVELFV